MKSSLVMLLSVMTFFIFRQECQAKMVYLYQKAEERQVALADDKGEFIRLLTPENLQCYHPDISSDGRYVAYSIGTISQDLVDVAVQVLDLQTGEIEVWTPSGYQYIHCEFSGNGQYLAYSGPVKKENGLQMQNIHLIHLPTARSHGPVRTERKNGKTFKYFQPDTEVIKSGYNSYFPALASDASFVIYHRSRQLSGDKTSKELIYYDRAQKSKKLLTDREVQSVAPSISWDDRYVAYAGRRGGQWDIYLLDLWNKEHHQVTDTSEKEFTPVFAPDGSIAYTRFTGSQPLQIDLYQISSDQVFGSRNAVRQIPLVADPEVAEYIPAFSGNSEFSLHQKPDLPDPARSSFGAAAYEGKIYVAGGHQGPEHTYPPESFLARLDIYDTKRNTWTQGDSMSFARQGFEMVAYQDCLYAFGGFAYSKENTPPWRSLDIIERYNIAEDSWEVLTTRLPRNRSSNIAVKLGSKVYLIGGWDSTPSRPGDKEGQFHSKIDVFDLNTLKISASSTELPDPLRRAFTAVVKDEEIILLGGISEGASHFNWLDNVTVFNPQSGRWREMTPLPFATFAPGAGIYLGKLFVFGGMNPRGRYQNTIYNLDLSGPANWINTGLYLQENKGFPIVIEHPQGGLGILGGHTYTQTAQGVIDTPVFTFEHLK